MTAAAEERIAELEAAIRRHRDQEGDDRCWIDDEELYRVLGEGVPERPLPSPGVMLENCKRYIASRHCPRLAHEDGTQGRWYTKSQVQRLESMIEKLGPGPVEYKELSDEELKLLFGEPEEEPSVEDALRARVAELEVLLNTPETKDFLTAVTREAGHQVNRWGSKHDGGKNPSDWFWLLGYLAGKALQAQVAGDTEKTLHHIISSAAALANWHNAVLGKNDMRPGIEEPQDAERS